MFLWIIEVNYCRLTPNKDKIFQSASYSVVLIISVTPFVSRYRVHKINFEFNFVSLQKCLSKLHVF